jgi:hypothetical protein
VVIEEQPEKAQHPQGWLRRAIEEDYAAPNGYRPAEERVVEAAEFQRHEEERQRMQAEEQVFGLALVDRALEL